MAIIALDRSRTPRMRTIEAQFGLPIREVLERKFREFEFQSDPHAAVGDALNVDRATIYGWCRRLGVQVQMIRPSVAN